MIVSISGMDNAGKTTQCQNLLKNYPERFSKILHLHDSPSFDQEKYNENWWFKTSNKEEFTEVIYRCLKERILLAYDDKKISLFDKSTNFYDYRIIATLIAKGMKYQDALNLQQQIKKSYIKDDHEDIKFYLESGPYRRNEPNFNDLKDIRYNLYQELNRVLLKKDDYVIIQPNDKEFMTQNIMSYIDYSLKEGLCRKRKL